MSTEALLTGVRVRLRPVNATDLAEVHALWTLPEIRRFLFDDLLLSSADVAEHLEASRESFASRGYGVWLVQCGSDKRPGGFAGLLHSSTGAPNLVVGLAPEHWRQGLAAEAATLVLRHAFHDLGLAEVRADVDEPNVASVRMLEKLGFAFEARALAQDRPLLYYRLGQDRLPRS